MSITLPPLPNRSCIVTYMGDGRGLHYTLGVAAGTALIEQPPGSQLDLYTADQMHAHAAAVTAAKDAEIERLHAGCAQLRADATDRQNNVVVPLREQVRVLEDALRGMVIANERHSFLRVGDALTAAIDAALAARKGEATTPPPSPSPRS